MDQREKQIRQKLKDDFEHYAKKCLKVRPKEQENSIAGLQPFILNKAQLYVHQLVEEQLLITGKVRVIIVKGRQTGCSTYVEGRYYWKVTHRFGVQAFILTHALDATANLYKMVKNYHDNCPVLVKPQTDTSNSKELIFGNLKSGYKIGTAENKSVGRSSTIQYFHGSEVAFWANATEHAKGILQAVPNAKGTEIILESTANGIGNYFHEMWQNAEAGINDYLPIFVPWFWMDEYKEIVPKNFVITSEEVDLINSYTLNYEQIYWRRLKIAELSVGGVDGYKSFAQEYPCNAQEAFQSTGENVFIAPDVAMSAAKIEGVEKYGPLLVGVDPARFGDDRTAIVRRQGRIVFNPQSFLKHDTMQVVGICHNIIEVEKPAKMFIDVVGIGAGIYDRLKELGHEDIIVAVNSGTSPLDKKKYYNKRAEMWGIMRDWLLDLPCNIPNDSALLSDLCGLQYKFDSTGRLVIEKKEDAKKRGIRSPDLADALALTFYYPVSTYQMTKSTSTNKSSKIMANFKRAKDIRASMINNR